MRLSYVGFELELYHNILIYWFLSFGVELARSMARNTCVNDKFATIGGGGGGAGANSKQLSPINAYMNETQE
jgi:hypothetical protein